MFYRFSKIMFVAIASAFLGSSPAAAHDITAKQAWSRATPKGAKVAGGYLTIENRGAARPVAFGVEWRGRQGRNPSDEHAGRHHDDAASR